MITAYKKMLTADKKMLTADKKMLTADKKRFTAEKMNLSADIEMLTADKNKLSEDVEMLTAHKNKLSEDVEMLTADKNKLSEDVEILTADKNKLSEDVEMLTADKKMLTADKNKLSEDVEMLTADNKSLRSELEFRRCCSYAVNVTLDPETAHPRNILSEDRKSVRDGGTTQNLPDNPQRFDACPCVLGLECFTLGRHYWEVEVGDKTNWDLGVCKDSVSRKGMISLTPEDGYWVVTQRYGDEYWACTSPNTLLPLSVRPRAVGIFLDYEAGKVSFYDADNISHLFTFTHTFTEKLWPYFNPGLNRKGKNAGALSIRPVPEWE
ncbi:E3 ubiquitin-protein ligase TRIM39-like isoform X1 [Microcaecilia unicolor]|uniref:E3 ubiquitin-protein ligase TRIM39-like isoform X1 n=1 Tax=Microcaecilia unicolor TaxID=1415580 RepID=A0A6P7XSK1_9AMPH|nr:E3 ubiquitin-protein ligase TRIM39-like isoform X1 [Microcaecilia unicolor]